MGVHVKKAEYKKGDTVVAHLNVFAPNRDQQTVGQARTAHKVAEFIHNPNRTRLYDLFEDIMLDPHLTGIVGKRMRMVRNKPLRMVDKAGKHLEHIEPLLVTKKFRNIRKVIFNNTLYSLSGLEFLFGKELDYKPIPRKHIKPHLKKIVRDQYGVEGWDYEDMPNVWIMETEEEDNNLGLLLKAVPYVLFKRHGFVDWSEFIEMYGQPTRVGKYDAYDENTRTQLEQALEKAGSALAMMIPKQADLEFIDGKTSNSNGDLQKSFIDACDEQLSILILGVTDTTKGSEKGGYSRSKTHEGQQLEVTQDDMDTELEYLNDTKFHDILRSYGWQIPEGAMFEHVEEADLGWLAEKLKVDQELAKIIKIDPQYFYDTYNIPMPKDGEQLIEEEDIDEDEQEEEDVDDPKDDPKKVPPPKKKDEPKAQKLSFYERIKTTLTDFFPRASVTPGRSMINPYPTRCNKCGGYHNAPVAMMGDDELKTLSEEVANMLYNGQAKDGYIHNGIYSITADKLMQGIYEGLGKKAFDYDDAGNELATYLQHNIHSFSAAKSLAEYNHFRDLMVGEDGKILSAAAYRNKVVDAGYLFNKNYLNTEYNTALSSAETAVEFNSFGEDEAIQVSTVGDDRVRPEHQSFDGFTALKSHPVWRSFCPPFDYECRCRLIPGVLSRVDHERATTILKESTISKHFQRNTALDKVVFDKNHPYYKKSDVKLKELTAVKNYNLPTLQRIYMDEFPEAQKLISKERANEWWTDMAGVQRGDIFLSDKTGLKIKFPNKFRTHVFEHNNDERWAYVANIVDIVAKPDEVWSYMEKGTLKKVYLKYFNDVPYGVHVEGTVAKTFYRYEKGGKINYDSVIKARRGALIYIKK